MEKARLVEFLDKHLVLIYGVLVCATVLLDIPASIARAGTGVQLPAWMHFLIPITRILWAATFCLGLFGLFWALRFMFKRKQNK